MDQITAGWRADAGLARAPRIGPRLWAGLAGIVCAAIVFAPQLATVRAHAPVALEDDGFYYAQIARTLARTGRSSFDGLTLTNGYHPLWLGLLTLKTRLIGDATWSVVALEAVCLGAAIGLLLAGARVRAWGPRLVFTALFVHYVGAMAGLGMEISLFALCASVFILALEARRGVRWSGALGLGAAAAACIAARIDAAVFVLPAVALCDRSRRERASALAVVAAAGAIYAGANLLVFGAALPISSAVKSLGGLQVNHRFLAQMVVEAHAFGREGGGRMLLTLAGCAAAPVMALAAPRGSTGRVLGLATGLGGALFVLKLALASSWQIWPWYSFPLVFVLATAFFTWGRAFDSGARAPARLALAVLGGCLATVVVAKSVGVALAPPPSTGFYAVNESGARRFATLTGGAPVAMGDRAGSFAWFYPGPVVQLEGLVNDARWLALLRARAAPAPELCRRGVAFVVAYGASSETSGPVELPLMRPRLTQYPAPTLRVWTSDELASVADPAAFSAALYGDGDPVLRLYRLRCLRLGVAAAPPEGAR